MKKGVENVKRVLRQTKERTENDVFLSDRNSRKKKEVIESVKAGMKKTSCRPGDETKSEF